MPILPEHLADAHAVHSRLVADVVSNVLRTRFLCVSLMLRHASEGWHPS